MGAFTNGLAAGYGIAIPVGAIAVLIVNKAAQESFRSPAVAGLGAASADLTYAVPHLRDANTLIHLGSGCVLGALGGYGILRAARSRGGEPSRVVRGRRGARGTQPPGDDSGRAVVLVRDRPERKRLIAAQLAGSISRPQNTSNGDLGPVAGTTLALEIAAMNLTASTTTAQEATMSGTNKKFVDLNGLRMAYTETGTGDPIVFLHGNPTSSYLWRHVVGEVADLGRCLAPDLIGMGDSDKLADSGPGSYTFAEHRKYLDAFFEAVGATRNVTLVGHDWGSALGFDWARRHPDAVSGIVYMEAAVRPGRWSEFPPPAVELFQALRSPAGEQMILENNLFVEAILPDGVLTPLAPEVLAEYRRPFAEPGEGRRPTLTWPRQIPFDGEPADVTAVMEGYGAWLAASPIRKLFVNADPGQVLVGPARDFCRTWPNQTEITVPGRHFIQEDSGKQIGHGLRAWLEQTPPTPTGG